MTNKLLMNTFENTKNFIWNHTHKDPAKMLIAMGALGFALSSMAQCFAIKINNKIDKKKKDFMLAQEAADGAVNIGLFLGITSSVWKISDRMIGFLGINRQNTIKSAKPNPNTNNHIKCGGRILTTIIASVIACNIITPLVRNLIAGKIRNHFEKKDALYKTGLNNLPKSDNFFTFKSFDNFVKPSFNNSYPQIPKTAYIQNNSGSLKI